MRTFAFIYWIALILGSSATVLYALAVRFGEGVWPMKQLRMPLAIFGILALIQLARWIWGAAAQTIRDRRKAAERTPLQRRIDELTKKH